MCARDHTGSPAGGEHQRNRHARTAGLAYLVIFATGIFAEFVVRASLIVPGDAAATASRIAGSELWFRAALASEFVMLACDVLVAVLLYVIFEPAGRTLALLAAFFRLAHAAVVAGNLLNTWVPLRLLDAAGPASGLDGQARQALSLLFLEAHGYGYVIGLMFFGWQCLVLGALVFRSGMVPRTLGLLLGAAGAGYLIDGVARTLLRQYADYEAVFAVAVFVPAFVGELAFAVWLLARGVRPPRVPAETAA